MTKGNINPHDMLSLNVNTEVGERASIRQDRCFTASRLSQPTKEDVILVTKYL
jgi:hypothetical protein